MAEGILSVSADQLELRGVRRVCSVRIQAANDNTVTTRNQHAAKCVLSYCTYFIGI
jgi:hypothetical protein